MERTYTYTLADYRELFAETQEGVVGVDPDGDLVWSRRPDIEWARETTVLGWHDLQQWGPDRDRVVYSPSPLQRAAFEARSK